MNHKIFLASDHAGVELKSKIIKELYEHRLVPNMVFEVHDLGPQSVDSVDYPDFADSLAIKIRGFSLLSSDSTHIPFPSEIGILICGSGQGMCMRANKYSHIRAALCHNLESAKLSREHNDANVLCLGARIADEELNFSITRTFLTTHFAGGRHAMRVMKMSKPLL
jgi:ribose 5-phosphate isomerase B